MGKHTYTDEHLAFLRSAYLEHSWRECARLFNEHFGLDWPEASIHCAIKNHKMRSGRTGQFRKGQVSWNKGTSYQPGGACASTQFKPGNRPQTWVPIGTEVLSKDGYRKRKIRDDAPNGQSRFNWAFVHTMTWEAANGPVPDGHVVAFRDGDKSNCDLENLVLLSRAESLYLNRNQYGEMPDELRQPMRNLARVEARRHELENRNDN